MAPSQNPGDYSIVFTMVGWSDLARSAIRLNDVLEADGRPAQASLVRKALFGLRDELTKIAKVTAVDAHKSIRSHELSSRVRPDTGGGGGPRLRDFIGVSSHFEPIPGTVLVNHEPTLTDNGVGWWWTNEEGYSGHIGRRFIGAFDGTRPDPGQFRQHALLQVGKVKNSGKGTIRNPIPERRFVRDGAAAAESHWHAQVQSAKAQYLAAVQFAVRQSRAQGRVRPAR